MRRALLSESAAAISMLQALLALYRWLQSWLRAWPAMEPDQTKLWNERRRQAAEVAAAQSMDPKGLIAALEMAASWQLLTLIADALQRKQPGR